MKDPIKLKIELTGFDVAKLGQMQKLDGHCLLVKHSQITTTNRLVGPTQGNMMILVGDSDSDNLVNTQQYIGQIKNLTTYKKNTRKNRIRKSSFLKIHRL